mmetsp:Transcript_5218/g.12576  ORF Transcript_5218/g.12576 Transcript_5218/m.12576 type:complete len:107 (-) Transcript_5218:352-672(-)
MDRSYCAFRATEWADMIPSSLSGSGLSALYVKGCLIPVTGLFHGNGLPTGEPRSRGDEAKARGDADRALTRSARHPPETLRGGRRGSVRSSLLGTGSGLAFQRGTL